MGEKQDMDEIMEVMKEEEAARERAERANIHIVYCADGSCEDCEGSQSESQDEKPECHYLSSLSRDVRGALDRRKAASKSGARAIGKAKGLQNQQDNVDAYQKEKELKDAERQMDAFMERAKWRRGEVVDVKGDAEKEIAEMEAARRDAEEVEKEISRESSKAHRKLEAHRRLEFERERLEAHRCARVAGEPDTNQTAAPTLGAYATGGPLPTAGRNGARKPALKRRQEVLEEQTSGTTDRPYPRHFREGPSGWMHTRHFRQDEQYELDERRTSATDAEELKMLAENGKEMDFLNLMDAAQELEEQIGKEPSMAQMTDLHERNCQNSTMDQMKELLHLERQRRETGSRDQAGPAGKKSGKQDRKQTSKSAVQRRSGTADDPSSSSWKPQDEEWTEDAPPHE
jgi:hypothetical protein